SLPAPRRDPERLCAAARPQGSYHGLDATTPPHRRGRRGHPRRLRLGDEDGHGLERPGRHDDAGDTDDADDHEHAGADDDHHHQPERRLDLAYAHRAGAVVHRRRHGEGGVRGRRRRLGQGAWVHAGGRLRIPLGPDPAGPRRHPHRLGRRLRPAGVLLRRRPLHRHRRQGTEREAQGRLPERHRSRRRLPALPPQRPALLPERGPARRPLRAQQRETGAARSDPAGQRLREPEPLLTGTGSSYAGATQSPPTERTNMERIEGRGEELLSAKNFANVATLRSDGSVLSAPVWVDVQDGRPVLNSAEGRAWPRNLERDPRITLTVQNLENPYEYVEVRGKVAERTHDGADEHIDALAKKYLDADSYPYRQPGEQRVIIRVEPEHVH